MSLHVVKRDDKSGPYKTYCASYVYQGAEWSVRFAARSEQEAAERLEAIGKNGVVDGVLMFSFPAICGSWLPALYCRIRHVFLE